MKKLSDKIIYFLKRQNFVIISTIDKSGNIHSACKGIVKINKNGKIYLLDLYKKKTFNNLRHNPHVSLIAVDEHSFEGYCLKGKGKIIKQDKFKPQMIKAWDDKVTSRITQRVLRNIRGERGHSKHPEILFPKPKYLIVMEVFEVIDLTPKHIK